MSLRSLLKKEIHWSRHNLLTLALVLLILPGFLVSASVAFQSVIPRDAPVAVVPANDEVSQESLLLVEAGLAFFSDPVEMESEEAALRELRRETVYAVVEVPPNITDSGEDDATFVLSIDGSMVPFREPSEAVAARAQFSLDDNLPANIDVRRQVVGTSPSLSEYLVPLGLLALVMLFAFTYVPYNLAGEAETPDRLRVEASLEAVIAAKLLFFGALLLVPILVFQGAAAYYGYATNALAPMAVVTLLLTFLFLAAISSTVMVLTRFSTVGRFVNAVILLGLLTFSGLAYPVGFFSGLRRTLTRALPTHYSAILTRSAMLKQIDTFGLFIDMLLALSGFTLVTFVVLKLAAVYYRRTT
jgi:ABC-2 type transport system permease protein